MYAKIRVALGVCFSIDTNTCNRKEENKAFLGLTKVSLPFNTRSNSVPKRQHN